MAKRIRRVSPETRESHSSQGSDSQDDMADNEMDLRRHVDRPEPLPSTSAPPKKKRTRTLTTPHQSAVLHALLAQVWPSCRSILLIRSSAITSTCTLVSLSDNGDEGGGWTINRVERAEGPGMCYQY